jgi:hypothetical protein
MLKIISILLSNGNYYTLGNDWEKIEKFYDENGKLWFAVSGKVDYNDDVNGDFVTIVRYDK